MTHVIHQPSRRGDDDVDAGAEGALLGLHRHAAEDRDARNSRVVRESLHLIFDLHGELARRRQHEGTRSQRLRRRFVEETLEDWDQKCSRLTCAGLCARDHVIGRDRQRNHAALDGSCLGPAEITDSAQQSLVK